MKSRARHRARRSAVQALYQWDLTEQDPAEIERHFVHEHDMSATDSGYFHQLIRNVPLYHQEIDANLAACLDRPVASVDPVERAILRLGAYELEYEREVPFRVIIDEAVELARTFGAEHGYKFVNGVLDRLSATLRAGEREPDAGA